MLEVTTNSASRGRAARAAWLHARILVQHKIARLAGAITLAVVLSGCVGGWLLQGGPGVFTESALQIEKTRTKGLTSSEVVSVEGTGWLVEPRALYRPYNFAASYSDGKSGVFLMATVLNGPKGGSSDGSLLVELVVSNLNLRGAWFSKEKWAKEPIEFPIDRVIYIADGNRQPPVRAISCPEYDAAHNRIEDGLRVLRIAAGSWHCLRLIFPVSLPVADQFSLAVSGFTLGANEVPSATLRYASIRW